MEISKITEEYIAAITAEFDRVLSAYYSVECAAEWMQKHGYGQAMAYADSDRAIMQAFHTAYNNWATREASNAGARIHNKIFPRNKVTGVRGYAMDGK